MRRLSRIRNVARALRFGRPKGIISQADYAARAGTVWFQAEPADTRIRRVPRSFGAAEADFSPMIDFLPPLGVLALSHGRALGLNGWVFTAQGEIIRETTWYGRDLREALFPAAFPAPVRLSGTCLSLISEFASTNYGHYVLDCLARIGIAANAGWPPSRIDHVYLYAPPSASARYLLAQLGIDNARCIWANQVGSVVADTLLVTTFPGTKRNYAAIVPETIGRPFAALRSGRRRVYLPRRGTRAAINSEQIEAISTELGLEVYDFKLAENEFEYIRSAELVVGPHGAGLTNIAVCRPGTKILEIIPSDHIYPYYYTLAEAGGLDYSYLVGESSEHRPPGSFGPSKVNFHVDPAVYRDALITLIGEIER